MTAPLRREAAPAPRSAVPSPPPAMSWSPPVSAAAPPPEGEKLSEVYRGLGNFWEQRLLKE